jgi:Aerotolerance regulator N-terminal
MTFLQPFILWGLPLILLPVLIHLLNRMRHRPQPWAAMRFLVSATRSSISNARLRQWLILLLRVLAVLMLVLFLSRPLAGGWLGWALAPAPDAILILLDRSASMEGQAAGSATTRRQQALESLAQAARPFEETSHLVLIDSASRAPQEISRAATLLDPALTGATDTAADIPGLMAAGVNWLVENRAGTAELWLASDLQKSNWLPDDPRWQSLAAQLHALPQRIRVRLLALNQSGQPNRSVSVREMIRRSRAGRGELQFAVDLQASTPQTETIPLTLNLDGTRTQQELKLEGQAFRWRHRVALGDRAGHGWGSFELPADGNGRDNVAYFVYGAEPPLRASVIGSESRSTRLLQLAIAAGRKSTTPLVDILPASNLGQAIWEDNTLVVWQDRLPSGAAAQRLRNFAAEGGSVLFLPPGVNDTGRFEGLGWGEVQTTSQDRPFRILRWNEEEGPLAKSDEGLSLPLVYTLFERRQIILGQKNVLAAFEDGTPFLARQTLGRGEIFFCASLPQEDWSGLGEGPVLVPMMQRLLQSGSRRLQQAESMPCGELSTVDQARRWDSVDSPTPKDIRTQAGVYRSGDRLLAVNRPKAEDDPEIMEVRDAERLFGPLAVQTFQERRSQTDKLQGEVWRVFLFSMLLFLVAEGVLILPAKAADDINQSGAPPQPATQPTAEARS